MDKKSEEHTSKCVYCGSLFDKKKIRRSYGWNSSIFQLSYCSAKCYTEDFMKMRKGE